MAAITQITLDPNPLRGTLCETIAITNQTAASTTVSKAISVPSWADYCTFVISGLTLGGTTPTFDFVVRSYNLAANSYATPDDGYLVPLGGWDGITQKTSGTSLTSTIDIGPNVPTDDTGSASASDSYGVTAVLPPWLVYRYTTTDAADDADYAAVITVYFKGA